MGGIGAGHRPYATVAAVKLTLHPRRQDGLSALDVLNGTSLHARGPGVVVASLDLSRGLIQHAGCLADRTDGVALRLRRRGVPWIRAVVDYNILYLFDGSFEFLEGELAIAMKGRPAIHQYEGACCAQIGECL